MADHFFSPEARLDLLEIWEYIAQDNVSAADRVVLEIREAITLLSSNPELGHVPKDLTSKPVRFWPIYSYLVIYDPAALTLIEPLSFSKNGVQMDLLGDTKI